MMRDVLICLEKANQKSIKISSWINCFKFIQRFLNFYPQLCSVYGNPSNHSVPLSSENIKDVYGLCNLTQSMKEFLEIVVDNNYSSLSTSHTSSIVIGLCQLYSSVDVDPAGEASMNKMASHSTISQTTDNFRNHILRVLRDCFGPLFGRSGLKDDNCSASFDTWNLHLSLLLYPPTKSLKYVDYIEKKFIDENASKDVDHLKQSLWNEVRSIDQMKSLQTNSTKALQISSINHSAVYDSPHINNSFRTEDSGVLSYQINKSVSDSQIHSVSPRDDMTDTDGNTLHGHITSNEYASREFESGNQYNLVESKKRKASFDDFNVGTESYPLNISNNIYDGQKNNHENELIHMYKGNGRYDVSQNVLDNSSHFSDGISTKISSMDSMKSTVKRAKGLFSADYHLNHDHLVARNKIDQQDQSPIKLRHMNILQYFQDSDSEDRNQENQGSSLPSNNIYAATYVGNTHEPNYPRNFLGLMSNQYMDSLGSSRSIESNSSTGNRSL